MFHRNKFSLEGLTAAIQLCKQAIARDPKYALAYAALARCYIMQGAGYLGPTQTFPIARKYVAEALKLDPDQADAHAALGAIHLLVDWDWKGAERELSRARALDPNVMGVRNLYGFWLAAQGRLPEALAASAAARNSIRWSRPGKMKSPCAITGCGNRIGPSPKHRRRSKWTPTSSRLMAS